MVQGVKTHNKKRHHYVPVGLSKNFCINKKTLCLYDTENERMLNSSPKDVFVGKKLHSIITENGEIDHNFLENQFMNIESNGLRAVNDILKSEELSDSRKNLLAPLIALQYLRTPIIRKSVEHILKEQIIAAAKVLDAQGELGEAPDISKPYGSNISELLDSGIIAPEISLKQVTMMGLSVIQEVCDQLLNMNWSLLEFSCDDYFLLSDHPFAILDPDLHLHSTGLGLVKKNIEITMPISKNYCLLFSPKDIPDKAKLSKSDVDNINQRSAFFGERFFVYPLQSKAVLDLVLQFKNCKIETQSLRIPAVDISQMVRTRMYVSEIELYKNLTPLF